MQCSPKNRAPKATDESHSYTNNFDDDANVLAQLEAHVHDLDVLVNGERNVKTALRRLTQSPDRPLAEVVNLADPSREPGRRPGLNLSPQLRQQPDGFTTLGLVQPRHERDDARLSLTS